MISSGSYSAFVWFNVIWLLVGLLLVGGMTVWDLIRIVRENGK